MKFKIDENLPIEIAELLNNEGCDAKTVTEQGLCGGDDSDIAVVCQEEERILVTLDTDFSDIRTYPPENYPGIIVMRLRRQDKLHIINIFNSFKDLIPKEPLKKHLWIISENQVRIRGDG
jgi:predicted nuclease of predicted toxin-antitoxin system